MKLSLALAASALLSAVAASPRVATLRCSLPPSASCPQWGAPECCEALPCHLTSLNCLDKGVRVCCPKDSAHAIKEPRLGTEHNVMGESEHDDRVGFVSLPVSETERIADKVDDREVFVSLPLSEMEAETTSSELDAPSEQRKTTLSAASCWPNCSDGGS